MVSSESTGEIKLTSKHSNNFIHISQPFIAFSAEPEKLRVRNVTGFNRFLDSEKAVSLPDLCTYRLGTT